MREFTKDDLKVRIYENRSLMGAAAAEHVSSKIAELLGLKEYVNIVFAAAPHKMIFWPRLSGNKWNGPG